MIELLRRLKSGGSGGFGPYETDGLLGMGTYAEVHRARFKRGGHLVAIKVLRLHETHDQDIVSHFERQARVLARLDHPNVVQIRDHGASNRHLWVVMDIAESTLERQLAPGASLPVETILQAGTHIGEALRYVHGRNIIHRDVKPSNILHGSHAYALADFGFAKVLDSQSVVTMKAQMIANVHYVSPEVITGRAVGPQADIYSLGMVLYHMATGAPPYPSGTMAEVINAQLHQDLPAVGSRNPDMPPALEAIIQRATQKHVEDRYQNITEMLVDLGRIRWEISSSVVSTCLGCGCVLSTRVIYCPRCGRRSF